MFGKNKIEYKTRTQIERMREAGLVVAAIHAALRRECRPGVSTKEMDEVSAGVIADHGAHSNFFGYYDFPATLCASPNEVIVHGIPDGRILEAGDIVSFDCGAYVVDPDGTQWHGDAAFSMIVGGDEAGSETDRQLDAVTQEAMWAALASLATGRTIGCVGQAVDEVVEMRGDEFGWTAGIVEEFCGHGIGTAMHQSPDVVNYPVRARLSKVKPGMVLAIEPMLTVGGIESKTLADEWTVVTVDGSNAAQWEHTVAILEDGISVLTSPDCGKEGLAPFGVTPINL